MKDIDLPVNLNRYKSVADMIDREIALLKGARKAVKLTGGASIEERIKQAKSHIAELEELSSEKVV